MAARTFHYDGKRYSIGSGAGACRLPDGRVVIIEWLELDQPKPLSVANAGPDWAALDGWPTATLMPDQA